MLLALILSVTSVIEKACFHCHCVPSSAGSVWVCAAHQGHRHVTMIDANGNPNTVTIPNSSTAS